MPMTMSQKILAAHCGKSQVNIGEIVMAKVDLVLGNDITAPVAIKEYAKINNRNVFDNQKIALVMDHFTPNKDIKAAEQCKLVRTFAKANSIKNFFDVGEMGVEHALLPEKGLVGSGHVVLGADSTPVPMARFLLFIFAPGMATTDMAYAMASGKAWFKVPSAIKFILKNKPRKWVSGKDVILHIIGKIGVNGALYKSMEFTGDGLANLTMDDRLCMANMAIEAGAKNGIFDFDEKTAEYEKAHHQKSYCCLQSLTDETSQCDEVMR